jgi:hypothetical protein
MSLKNAFNKLISRQARPMTYHQLSSGIKETINVAPSNFFRNLAVAEELVGDNREYVIPETELTKISVAIPKRGDKLIDATFGVGTIYEIHDMVVLGNIVGWRVRVN